MTKNLEIIAVIPARGGSKRIPRKNIKEIGGKPLISWVIDLSKSFPEFSDVIVSTDDSEIAEISKKSGATVRGLRAPELSGDFTPTIPVISDAIRTMTYPGSVPEFVCCLYPAALFCTPDDLGQSLELLRGNPEIDYVASVVEYPHPIQRAFGLGEDGKISINSAEAMKTRTQDLRPFYHDAGQFYWGRTDAWLRHVPIFENAMGYKLRSSNVVDIDTEDDWERAESLFQFLKSSKT